ncbi:transcriptional regulator with XRE-family HTH domain [Ensifer sp. WSM1721]|uniref:helix-turn-helix domain-containing protein n=1 Tax=Ensifer sp. WSM1721 TaxID=1041159 RepID=UPI000688F395|nr:helix-turn-helix transcriptional regulator [Ensifer sp. WSM1721]
MGRSAPNAIDVFVGRRIRLRRTMLEMSGGELAEALGVAIEEIRRHEKGADRVCATRLQAIAEILQVHFSFFFQDTPSARGGGSRAVSEIGVTMNGASVFLSEGKARRRAPRPAGGWWRREPFERLRLS